MSEKTLLIPKFAKPHQVLSRREYERQYSNREYNKAHTVSGHPGFTYRAVIGNNGKVYVYRWKNLPKNYVIRNGVIKGNVYGAGNYEYGGYEVGKYKGSEYELVPAVPSQKLLKKDSRKGKYFDKQTADGRWYHDHRNGHIEVAEPAGGSTAYYLLENGKYGKNPPSSQLQEIVVTPKDNKSPKLSSRTDRTSRGSSRTTLSTTTTQSTSTEPKTPYIGPYIGGENNNRWGRVEVPKEANTPLLPSMNNRSQWGNYWNSLDNLGKYNFMGQVASMDGGTDWSTLSLNDWNSYFNNYYNKPWDTGTEEGAKIFAGMLDYYNANRKKYGKTGLDSEDATHLNMLYNDYLRNDIWNNVLAARKGKLDLNTYQGQYKGLIQSLANANEKSAKNYLFNLWNTENDVNTPQGRANFVADPKINNVGEPLKYIGGDYPHLNTNVDRGIVTLGDNSSINNESPNYSPLTSSYNEWSNLGMHWVYGDKYANAPNATSFIHGVRELTSVPQQFDVASGFRRYLKENPISKKQGGLLPRVSMYKKSGKIDYTIKKRNLSNL